MPSIGSQLDRGPGWGARRPRGEYPARPKCRRLPIRRFRGRVVRPVQSDRYHRGGLL